MNSVYPDYKAVPKCPDNDGRAGLYSVECSAAQQGVDDWRHVGPLYLSISANNPLIWSGETMFDRYRLFSGENSPLKDQITIKNNTSARPLTAIAPSKSPITAEFTPFLYFVSLLQFNVKNLILKWNICNCSLNFF